MLKCSIPPKELLKIPQLGIVLGCALSLAISQTGIAQPYAITTIAGSNTEATVNGPSSDGTNKNALFFGPAGVALNTAGTLYVADGCAIRSVTPIGTNWVVATLAGVGLMHGATNGSNSLALFDDPGGIAIDPANNLYVADTVNNSIRMVALAGTNWAATTLAGPLDRFLPGAADGTNGSARFNQPNGIAIDSGGNLYVADTLNDTIRKISLTGTNWVVTTLAGAAGTNGAADGTNGIARFNEPAAIAVDPNTNLYVADLGNNTIRKITPSGTNWIVTTLAGLAGTNGVGSADGTNSKARFNLPLAITRDAAGNLYVSDSGNYTIRRLQLIGTNWVVTTLAGSPGTSAGVGSSNDGIGAGAIFGSPDGIIVDPAGNLYIADSYKYTVRQGHLAALLQATVSASKFILSWPSALTGYVCQASSGSLSGPWNPNTNGIATSGNFSVQTNSVQPGSMYFRLHMP